MAYGWGSYVSCEVPRYNCAAGYYLPANTIECAQCLNGNICAGGSYLFDATNAQGIALADCDPGYSTPAGSSSISDCAANVISIYWEHADSEDIAINNAGSVTFGGDINTPKKAQHIKGKTFTGWTFSN